MGCEMREGAGGGDDQHEACVAPGAEAPRQSAAERDQPSYVKADMEKVGVQERVREEGPQVGAEAAGKRHGEIRVVARRNERERQEKLAVQRLAVLEFGQ